MTAQGDSVLIDTLLGRLEEAEARLLSMGIVDGGFTAW